MKIYSYNETDFTHNGLGVLIDFIDTPIQVEELNGINDLSFRYSLVGLNAQYLVENNIIKTDTLDGEQLYYIRKVTKKPRSIEVYATHISYKLNDDFLEDVAPTSLNCVSALNWILTRTVNAQTRFTGYSDISTLKSARYVRKNVLEAILTSDNSILKTWGGELFRDNFVVKILTSRGANRGVQIRYGKNFEDMAATVDLTNLCTKIMPQGRDELLLPEKYVTSPLINNYPTPIIKHIEFDVGVDENTTLAQAQQLLRDKCNELFNEGLDKPQINVKVNFIELSKYEEYKNLAVEKIYLGDTINFIYEPLNINLNLRVVKTTYDTINNKLLSFEIGEIKTTYSDKQIQLENDIKTIPSSVLAQAKQEATDLINAATTGYVVTRSNEILIMDTNDITTATKVWRWNQNGLGYSSTGYAGPYGIAITNDGKIVADYIATGILDGAFIKTNSIESEQLTISARNIGSKNILQGADFESPNAIDFWNTNAQCNLIRQPYTWGVANMGDAIVLKGKQIIKSNILFEDYTSAGMSNFYLGQDNIYLQPNTDYTISFWHYKGGNTDRHWLSVWQYDNTDDTRTVLYSTDITYTYTGNFVYYKFSFKTGANTKHQLRFYSNPKATAVNGNYLETMICQPQIEKGKYATDFKPNANELNNTTYTFNSNGFILKNRNNSTTLSADGIVQTNTFAIADNLDASYPMVIPFYIDTNTNIVQKVTVDITLQKYRAYSRGTTSGGSSTTGIVSGSQLSGSDKIGSVTDYVSASSHGHYPSVDFVNTINNHIHNTPNHSHSENYGIYEGTVASSVNIYVDGILRKSGAANGTHDISTWVTTSGKHTVEFRTSSDTRIVANVFIKTFHSGQ